MELLIIILSILGLLYFGIAGLVLLSGRFMARNEQRAYVMDVLHNVEARGDGSLI